MVAFFGLVLFLTFCWSGTTCFLESWPGRQFAASSGDDKSRPRPAQRRGQALMGRGRRTIGRISGGRVTGSRGPPDCMTHRPSSRSCFLRPRMRASPASQSSSPAYPNTATNTAWPELSPPCPCSQMGVCPPHLPRLLKPITAGETRLQGQGPGHGSLSEPLHPAGWKGPLLRLRVQAQNRCTNQLGGGNCKRPHRLTWCSAISGEA